MFLRSLKYDLNNNKERLFKGHPLVAMRVGCTAVVALVSSDGHVHVANIGDSRCVLSIKDKCYPLTKDHKPTDKKERERIERAGSRIVNGRINRGLNLSRSFGDHLLKMNKSVAVNDQAIISKPDIECNPAKIRANDFMILACDGIWNCMSNKQVCKFVKKHLKHEIPVGTICELLVKKCVSPVRPIKGQTGGDNMTCIIIQFKQTVEIDKK